MDPKRLSLDEILKRHTPKKLILMKDGTRLSLVNSEGVADVALPTFDPGTGTIHVEEKDVEWHNGSPSIASNVSVALLPPNMKSEYTS